MAAKVNKVKFSEGERVLCYEPDLTKAKVLYDSKVLDIVVNKDSKGKKTVEYLIHFQGWNSSWDRCVQEEFVLKDSPENRQLQRDLADQSQLQFGTYLYRRERKKHNRKTCEQRNSNIHSITNLQIPEDCSSASPPQTIDTEEFASALSSSEAESFVEDELVSIELTDYLKNVLEHDYYLINNKDKLMKLPAEPHVVAILENYWKHYCTSLWCELSDKPNNKLNRTALKMKPEDIQHNLNLCKEMLDGLRIYFDFTLNDLLLYKSEKGQVDLTCAKTIPLIDSTVKREERVRTRSGDLQYSHLPNVILSDVLCCNQNNRMARRPRRRSLRTNRAADMPRTNGVLHNEFPSTKETQHTSSIANASESMEKIMSWRLLPNYVYNQQLLPPSLVYGATHLIRLFVKLPELLNASGIMENKHKALQEHLQVFLNYLTDQKQWYGDKFYTD